MKRTIILLVGDDHAGNKLGLYNPDTQILEETETGEVKYKSPDLTEIQKFLWSEYTNKYLPKVFALAGNDEIILIKMGDGIQGTRFFDELISSRLADQLMIQYNNIEPILSTGKIKKLRIIKGTGSHALGEGSSDLLLDDWIRQKHPDIDVKTLYHGCFNVNGAIIDCSHHGPSAGIRSWLRGNVLRLYVKSSMMEDIIMKKRPAHVIARAHVHTPLEEYVVVGEYGCWGIITPPLCFPGDFARKVTQSVKNIEIGVTAIEIINSNDDITIIPHRISTKLDIRTKEVL